MKLILRSYLLFILLYILAGCNGEDIDNSKNERVPVAFSTNGTTATRTYTNDLWQRDDTIAIFMFKHGQSLHAENILEGTDNFQHVAADHGYTTEFFPCWGGKNIFYPADAKQNVDFIVYHPFTSNLLSNYTFTVNTDTQHSRASLNRIDILYARTTKENGYNKHSGAVELEFKHLMSKLTFLFESGEGSPSTRLMDPYIVGMYSSGTVDLNNGNVVVNDIVSPNTMKIYPTLSNDSTSCVIIPQSVTSSSKLELRFGDGNIFTYKFAPKTFEAGKEYKYNLTLNKTGIVLDNMSVDEWKGTDEPPTTGGFQKVKYQVGDYYPNPQNALNAIGVVYKITDQEGYHGKFVSLEYVVRKINVGGKDYSLRWGNPNVNESDAGVSGIKSMTDGYEGTKSLIQKRMNEPNFAETYSVFNWIHTVKNETNINGVWYLPSTSELKSIKDNLDIINQKIEQTGRGEIPNLNYLAIAERDQTNCHALNMNNDVANLNKSDSNWSLGAVAVGKF